MTSLTQPLRDDEILLPLLDARLTEQQADEMLTALHAAAYETRDQAPGGHP